MLVNNDKVCYVICPACICKLFDNIVSAIDAVGVGKDQAHFLYSDQ